MPPRSHTVRCLPPSAWPRDWRSELDVVAAIRGAGGRMLSNSSADTVVETGDLLIAIGRADSLGELGLLARGTNAGAKARAWVCGPAAPVVPAVVQT